MAQDPTKRLSMLKAELRSMTSLIEKLQETKNEIDDITAEARARLWGDAEGNFGFNVLQGVWTFLPAPEKPGKQGPPAPQAPVPGEDASAGLKVLEGAAASAGDNGGAKA